MPGQYNDILINNYTNHLKFDEEIFDELAKFVKFATARILRCTVFVESCDVMYLFNHHSALILSSYGIEIFGFHSYSY